MDVDFEIGDYRFEWNSEKAEKNLIKHGICFEDAVLVFLDENKIEEFDEIHSDDEDRYKVIGRVGKVLVVIYTERGDRNRIISARNASKQEKEEYYEQFCC